MEGDEFLLKVALALLLLWEEAGSGSVQDFAQSVLSQRALSADDLFARIKRVKVPLLS